MKRKIIENRERGVSVAELARTYNRSASTIWSCIVFHSKKLWRSLSEEEVTARQHSPGAVREMLKAWETVASYIEKHHPNKAVAMRATNLFNYNPVSHFHQIFKCRKKQMSLYRFLVKKELDMYHK